MVNVGGKLRSAPVAAESHQGDALPRSARDARRNRIRNEVIAKMRNEEEKHMRLGIISIAVYCVVFRVDLLHHNSRSRVAKLPNVEKDNHLTTPNVETGIVDVKVPLVLHLLGREDYAVLSVAVVWKPKIGIDGKNILRKHANTTPSIVCTEATE